MKSSRFNIIIDPKDSNSKKILFNSYSCSLAIVDKDFLELIENIDKINQNTLSKKQQDILETAITQKFIVNTNFDELQDYKDKRNFQKYSSEILNLTIAPTLNCNFKCTYCYEINKSWTMTNIIMNKLVDFVKINLKNIKKLNVAWYGGEPLMCKNTIDILSKKFLKICEENNIEYNAFIVTNGSLITDEIVNMFNKINIKKIQITLDGDKVTHNSRRISKNGQDYFDCIINNINKLLQAKLNVTIRINIDKTNINNLDGLFKTLSKKLISKSVKINFAQVIAHTKACKCISSHCYTTQEFSNKLFQLHKYIIKYGFEKTNPLKYPTPKYNYCSAEISNAYVIDALGNIYKCWNEIGNTKYSIGNIQSCISYLNNNEHNLWLQNNRIENDKCINCPILPICAGGCPHKPVVENANPICDTYKYNLNQILKYYYLQLKK